MCKHVAAVLYGVGARLDENSELFFQLRNVDHSELITAAGAATGVTRATKTDKAFESIDLSALFGIELEADGAGQPSAESLAQRRARSRSTTKLKGKNAGAKKR